MKVRITSASDFWWSSFKNYLNHTKNVSDWRNAVNSGDYALFLSDFLYSPDGAKNKVKVNFGDELFCGSDAPSIKVITLEKTLVTSST